MPADPTTLRAEAARITGGVAVTLLQAVDRIEALEAERDDLAGKLVAAVAAPLLSEEINALSDRVRYYIHDIETRCDPAGDVQTIASLREQVDGLLAERSELQAERDEARSQLAATRRTLSALDCRYTGAGVADVSGSHCPPGAPCERCQREAESEAAPDIGLVFDKALADAILRDRPTLPPPATLRDLIIVGPVTLHGEGDDANPTKEKP